MQQNSSSSFSWKRNCLVEKLWVLGFLNNFFWIWRGFCWVLIIYCYCNCLDCLVQCIIWCFCKIFSLPRNRISAKSLDLKAGNAWQWIRINYSKWWLLKQSDNLFWLNMSWCAQILITKRISMNPSFKIQNPQSKTLNPNFMI